MNLVPNYPYYTLAPGPHHPPPCTMATFEPLVVDDTPDVESHMAMGESGLPSPPLPKDTSRLSKPPLISYPNNRALQRLVSRDVPQDELPSVIEAIVSDTKATDIVECLQGGDAQTFIDVIDKARHHAIL